MALGKPVIASAYSATLEFAGESNSYPVPVRMIEVGEAAAPYPSSSRWADPDGAVAAEQMARVFADHQAAGAVGAGARADMNALHSPAARGTVLRRLLDEGRRVPAPPVLAPEPPPAAPPVDVFEAEAMAAESLLGSPRADLPSPLRSITVPLRRLVLRCVRVYWVQQLAIHRALLRAMRTLRRQQGEAASHAAAIREQGAAQERMAAETARLREEVASLTAEVRVLQERRGGGRDVPRSTDEHEAPSGAGAARWPGGSR
jgi:hypothetical protein